MASQAPRPTLTVGQLAARSGVAASALRYYEDRDLLAPERDASGYRRYPRAALRRVAFIVFAQRVGLSLAEIAHELAGLPSDRAPSRADWEPLAATWTARIDAEIAALHRLRDGLTACIGCGCLSLDRCALANPDDEAAGTGSGPWAWRGLPGTASGDPSSDSHLRRE